MEPASQSVDKAVSTEDLGLVTRDIHLEVARLEAMLNTLVENKVESMKAEKSRGSTGGGDSSRPSGSATTTGAGNGNGNGDGNGTGPATTSDKHTQRITSTSTASSSQRVAGSGRGPKRKRRNHHWDSEHGYNKSSSHASRIEMSPRRSYHRRAEATTNAAMDLSCCEHGVHLPAFTDDEDIDEEEDMNGAFDFLAYADHRAYVAVCDIDGTACSCADNHNGQIMKLPYDDDYVSINIDDFENVEEDAIIAHDALRRARRKRRKRRKKRKRRLHRERERQRLAAATVATVDKVKVIDPDDLPQRARWTIVATACLLLLMCLLLVGVTLRMAPIIDDMVRKENEELMNSLNRDSGGWNSTSSAHATSSPSQTASRRYKP